MSYEFDSTDNIKADSQHANGADESHEILLACGYQNPVLCPGGGTGTRFQAREMEKDPNYKSAEGILLDAERSQGVSLHNPYAGGGDPLSSETDGFKTKDFDKEKENIGNSERTLVARFRTNTVWKTADSYASLTEASTAAGESLLERGSQIPYLPVNVADPSYPRYVLKDQGYYDLGSTALDYLYTGASALKDLRRQPNMSAKEKELGVQEKRIQWDIDTALGATQPHNHDMSKILDELSGAVYKDYGSRFQDWKANIIDKYNNPEDHIYHSQNLDAATMIGRYQAKAARDIALIDMALIKNDAGDRQKLELEIGDLLKRATKLDESNPDLQELQQLAPHSN